MSKFEFKKNDTEPDTYDMIVTENGKEKYSVHGIEKECALYLKKVFESLQEQKNEKRILLS